MTSATDEMLPCPFCGGTPRVKYLTTAGVRTHAMVECSKCHIKTDYYVHEFGNRNIVKVWNRRAERPTLSDLYGIWKEDA